jgi:hypothetical protein
MADKEFEKQEQELYEKKDHFIFELKNTTRLLWRYFNDITEEQVNSPVGHRFAEVEIDEDGKKEKKIAKMLTGYCIDEKDLFAIEDVLYKIQKRADELVLG